MSNLSLRGLAPDALSQLKRIAAQQNASVNSLILGLIDQGLGRSGSKAVIRRHDDLDALAGSWQKEDLLSFEQAIAPFEAVDPAIWK